MNRLLSPVFIFGFGLIVINCIAFLIMIFTGELIGDVGGFSVRSIEVLTISLCVVVAVYFFYLFALFYSFERVRVFRIALEIGPKGEDLFSYLLLALQVLFLVFSLANGVNVSGSGNNTTNSVFSFFWVFVSPDLLFIIYYGVFRRHRLFKFNLATALLSGLLRGRADIFLFVIFMELSKLYIENKLSFKKVLIWSLSVISLYPFLLIGKFTFRLYFGGDSGDLVQDASMLLDAKNSQGNIVFEGLVHVIGRLQLVSIVNEIYTFRDTLQQMFFSNQFFPFWKEGIHGIIFDALAGNPRNMPLGTAFTAVGNFGWSFEVGDWNTNPGLAGWFVLLPLHGSLLIFYTAGLCFLSFLLHKQMPVSPISRYSLWYCWAFLLMPGWLGVFVLFVLSQVVFLSLVSLIKIFSRQ